MDPRPPVTPASSNVTFNRAFALVLQLEGGLSLDRLDRGNKGGNATNYGITQQAFDEFSASYNTQSRSTASLDISRQDDYKLIKTFYNGIWTNSGAENFSAPVAIMHFDSAVNHGLSGARKLIEKASKICGPEVSPALDVDANEFFGCYLSARQDKYESIVENQPNQSRFMNGWMNRLGAVAEFVSGLSH